MLEPSRGSAIRGRAIWALGPEPDSRYLVERVVTLANGSTQRVLAPQVYLMPRSGDLAVSGALISGNSIDLNLSGDSLNLCARNDLNNLGGRIEAISSLSLQAGRDINVVSGTVKGSE